MYRHENHILTNPRKLIYPSRALDEWEYPNFVPSWAFPDLSPSPCSCRWLEVQMVTLTCTQRWVQYLQLLQESIWPGGVLPAVPKPPRTEEQKKATAEQALQSLMGILPSKCVPEPCQLPLGEESGWGTLQCAGISGNVAKCRDGGCSCQGTGKPS